MSTILKKSDYAVNLSVNYTFGDTFEVNSLSAQQSNYRPVNCIQLKWVKDQSLYMGGI